MSTVIGHLHAVLGLDATAFQQGMSNAASTLRGVGRSMQQVGRQMSAAVSVPLAGIGGLSLKVAGDFEASMNRVQAATGAGTAEMAALEAAALEMGETTRFKASQAAEAIEVLARNGLDASQIMGGALQGSMLLAASSGAGLASSGDLATDVMLQFGKEAGDLTGLVDTMTGAMLSSKFGFEEYRLAIAQAGGVAGGLGVGFEDFNAAIAGASQLFASGSDAGTAYKTFLQRLVPASAPAAAAMRDLGLEFFEADGSMKSMAEVAQELQDGLAGLSDEARNDALSTIFGTDALRTAIGLADQGAAGIERLKATIAEASAEEQAEARMKGLNGEMAKLASALEALMIAVAKSGILEFATDLARQLTELVLRLKDTNPEMLKMGTVFGALAIALGPLLVGIGLLLTGLGPLIGLVGAMSAPFALAAAAIAAAGLALYQNWESVGPWFKDLAMAIGQHFTGLVQVLQGIVTGDMALVVQGFRNAWEGITAFWSGLWNGITAAITYAWEEVIRPVTDKLGMTDEIVKGWERVKAMFDTVLDGIAGAFTAAWEKIEPVVTKLTSAWARLNASRDGAISSGYDPSGDPGDAGLILPTAGGHMADGLAVGTSGMEDQGYRDAEDYDTGFRKRQGINSPARAMIEIGQYMSQGLGIGIGNGQALVETASDRLGGSMAERFRSHFAGITDNARSLSDVFENVRTSFLRLLDDMASRLMSSGLQGIIGGLFGAVDPLAGALQGAGLNAIPAFATGTNFAPGGLARINELGGEIVDLPRGSRVYPHDISRRMADGAGNGELLVRLQLSDDLDARIMRGADRAANVRVERFASAELPGRVSEIRQYEEERM
ncbi:phage tail tape measure protein [Paracoccus sp. SM22M-07]|uniref:phage tail tape measure protein n=1 Tax=Paracoccus sp. SM22M-07 TaxID=1520813 RepID=UPI000930FCF0|nr:phage tail tape measure protein [Paracoccus sp. SM22M-07]